MESRSGVFFALAAFTSWGLLPVYWKCLAGVPALEILMHRVAGTVVFAALLLARVAALERGARRSCARRVRCSRSPCRRCCSRATGSPSSGPSNRGEIVATSLGYYLNPIVNVALGVLVLRERLRPLQLVAVAIAAVGVAYFTRGAAAGCPWISLLLATSFALYGLMRKTVAVASLAGLAVETGAARAVRGARHRVARGARRRRVRECRAARGAGPALLVARASSRRCR